MKTWQEVKLNASKTLPVAVLELSQWTMLVFTLDGDKLVFSHGCRQCEQACFAALHAIYEMGYRLPRICVDTIATIATSRTLIKESSFNISRPQYATWSSCTSERLCKLKTCRTELFSVGSAH